MLRILTTATIFLAAMSGPALAHLNPAEHGSFSAGLTHPLFGFDHVLAMIAVGLWASLIGGRAMWLFPAAFVATMALGFGAALYGLPVPFAEPVILASVVVLGLLVATALRVSAAAGMVLVGAFAFFHGHAHGSELGAAGAALYAAGFMAATVLLHAVGIAIGLAGHRLLTPNYGHFVIRGMGAAVACTGLALAFSA